MTTDAPRPRSPSASPADGGAPPVAPSPDTQRKIELTRWLATSSLLGLIALGLAWELWLAPLRPGGSSLVLKVVPLCLPLAGLLKNRMYTYRWVSLMVWLYFTEGVVRAWGDAPPGRYLALVEVLLCLLLFTACALHVRIRLKAVAGARETAAPGLPAQP